MDNSAEYSVIRQVIRKPTGTPKAVQAKHTRDLAGTIPRKFLPYLLGPKDPDAQADERVLCYQYEGPTTASLPGWRCLNVSQLVPGSASIITFTYGGSIPDPLTYKKVKKQNCVNDIDQWRQDPYVSG